MGTGETATEKNREKRSEREKNLEEKTREIAWKGEEGARGLETGKEKIGRRERGKGERGETRGKTLWIKLKTAGCAPFVELAIFEISESTVIKSGVFCQMRKLISKTRSRFSCCKNREKIYSAGESKIVGLVCGHRTMRQSID